MERKKEDLLAMLIEVIAESTTGMELDVTDCGVQYSPTFRWMPNVWFTQENVEAINLMAKDGDNNAETLIEWIKKVATIIAT